MKSKLLSRQDVSRSDEFKKDISVLMELPDDVLRQLPKHIANITLTRSRREDDEARDSAAQAIGVERATLDHALDIGQYFLKEFFRSGAAHGDDPTAITQDLVKAQLIPEGKTLAISDFLATLQTIASTEVEPDLLKVQHGLTSLPVVKSIGTSVDFRAVFDDSYKVGYSVEDFKPKCLGTVPIVLVHLGLDEGPIEDVHFHADLRSIRLIIEHLQAAEKQVSIAQAYLALEGEDKRHDRQRA